MLCHDYEKSGAAFLVLVMGELGLKDAEVAAPQDCRWTNVSEFFDQGFTDLTALYYSRYICRIHIPVVPHKAVAEVSKIGNL